MGTTHLVRHVSAPRHAVYRALLDPAAVQHWMVPDGMTSEVHEFDARTGGTFRISLTYTAADGVGKSSASTDTFHGRFVALEPDRRVVQAVEFETDDPQLQGEMIIAYELADAADGDGTEVVSVHEHLPPGVSEADNELGWSMSLAKLAALLER